MFMTIGKVVGQSTTPGNVAGFSTDFLGWDNTGTNNFPLQVRHDLNQPIEWYTDAQERMRLSPTLTGQNWGWFNTNSLDLSGHLGIGSPTPQRPLTYLHLNSSLLGGITVGYRPWMRVGVFSTQGTDGMYAGMRALDGRTESVINWSDDDNASFAQDNLSFVFTSTPDSSSTASRFRGLEVARMIPALNGNEGFFGVGDWRTAGLQPTERLDLLDGRARFRELTDPANEANGTYKVMVVDDAAIPSGERGVVKWVDPSVFAPATDCEWTMNTASPNHVSTAFGAADPNCPDNSEAVGIGVDLSTGTVNGKLNVRTNNYVHALDVGQISGAASGNGINVIVGGPTTTTRGINITSTQGTSSSADNRGVSVQANGTGSTANDYNFGIFAAAQGPTRWSRGVHGESNGATFFGLGGEFISNDDSDYAAGAEGYVTGGTFTADGLWGYSVSNAGVSSGVRGTVNTPAPSGVNKRYNGVMGVSLVTPVTTQRACGVYGEALGATDSWAIYANGNQFSTTGTAWTLSDAQLKQNIEPLSNATAMVMQLQPRSYAYRTEEYPQLHLATEPQFGFIAQELEQVLPDMVRDVFIPSETDSTGQELQASMSVKAVKLDGILPLIVAAMKEQQDIILAQQEAMQEVQQRLDEMQHALAACCANPDGSRMRTPTNATEPLLDDRNDDRKLRIVPNPFNEITTVSYTLERSGRT